MINIRISDSTGIEIEKEASCDFRGVSDFRKNLIYSELSPENQAIFDSFFALFTDLETTISDIEEESYVEFTVPQAISFNEVQKVIGDYSAQDQTIITNFINMVKNI